MTLSPRDLPPVDESTSAKVLVALDLEPPRQNRWSVFFRGILVIPLAIALMVVAIPVYVVVILSWFAGVFTGRVPESFHKFMTNFLRFSANLSAYEALIIPTWPGINWTARAEEQVTIEIANVKQSRLSIFFRGLLSYPAGFLGAFWNIGHAFFLIVMWVWTLIRGRAPTSLHQYSALWLRYTSRLSAYSLLLTPEQPWHGMRGDGIIVTNAPAPVVLPTSEESAPPTLNTFAPMPPIDMTKERAGGRYNWYVTARARSLVAWSIPIGVIGIVVYFVLIVVLVSGRISQTIQVTNSYDATYDTNQTFTNSLEQCTTVKCINAVAFVAFQGQLHANSYLTDSFSGERAQYIAYSSYLNDLSVDYSLMSREGTVSGLRATAEKWKADFSGAQTECNALVRALA